MHRRSAGAGGARVVFKTLSEQHLGDLSLVRVYSGHLEQGKDVVNTTRSRPEKLSTLYNLVGKERLDCAGAEAGDIVAAVKLKETHTGDTLADKARPVGAGAARLPGRGHRRVRSTPRTRATRRRWPRAWRACTRRIPTFRKHVRSQHQGDAGLGMGDLQLEVMVDRLQASATGVEVLLHPAARALPRDASRARPQDEYRHKKQTGGRGQFGEVHLRLEPLKRGEGFEFLDEIKGGVVPNQFIPAVEKGVIAGMEKGPLAGYPVVDVQVALFFGKYHDVDSSEMAFKIAAETCFHQAHARRRARSCWSRSTRSRCASPRSTWAT